MKRKFAPKPRNPFVQHLVAKKQGAHQKSYKVSRRDAKVALKKADYSTKHYDVLLSSLITKIFCIPVPEWSMGTAF